MNLGRTYKAPLAEPACDFLKLLRSQWMTREDVASALGWHQNTVERWAQVFLQHGILREAPGLKPVSRTPGRAPALLAVSKEWGGQA